MLDAGLLKSPADFYTLTEDKLLTHKKQLEPMGERLAKKIVENIAKANQDFDIELAVDNLATGKFTNPDNTYYSAPQQLNNQGLILGHTHITIQVCF